MAFPTIADADTTNGTVTSNSTSWTLTYPTNIAAGDLLLIFEANDGTSVFIPTPTGWTGISQNNGASAVAFYAAIAAGTESGTFTYTTSGGAEQGAWRIFRIPAASWFGGTVAAAWSGGLMNNDGLAGSMATLGSPSANPDPPNLDPTNWATEDTLWLAACGVDTSRTVSVYPLADRNTADVSGGAGGATLGLCTTTSAVSSLDPGTFTISTSDDWSTATIAVRPAAAAARVPRFSPYPQLLAH